MARNKALSYDCVLDRTFKLCCEISDADGQCSEFGSKLQRVMEVFTPAFWRDQYSGVHLVGRLIALSKIAGVNPAIDQIRPIVVNSPIVRLLEAPILDSLRIYCNDNLCTAQAGFLGGCSTATNLVKLVNELKRRDNKAYVLFLDISKAYDTVNRSILLEILKQRNILGQNEMMLLRFLLDSCNIKIGCQLYRHTRGLPQGSTIAPLLFNIYLDQYLRSCSDSGMFALGFADEICLVGDDENIIVASINRFERFCADRQLQINKSKSAVVSICRGRGKKQWREEICGIPIKDNYKYLGFFIGSRLNMDEHLNKINSSVFLDREDHN